MWSFSIHEFGDVRESCSKVGPALVTDDDIDDLTIDFMTSIDFVQSFTQDDYMQDIGPIIGHSILVTTVRDDSEVNVGCCVIGKGSPIEQHAGM